MADSNDPPIVVSGGSVTLEYDPTQLPPNGNGNRYNANKKIHRVTVERNGVKVYEEDIPDGRVRVIVNYRDGGTTT